MNRYYSYVSQVSELRVDCEEIYADLSGPAKVSLLLPCQRVSNCMLHQPRGP